MPSLNHCPSSFVIPANAGIHGIFSPLIQKLDAGMRQHDEISFRLQGEKFFNDPRET